MDHFGHDIFSNVVEHLSQGGPTESKALKALSLSCHALLPLCQAIIFRAIEFPLQTQKPSISTHPAVRFNDLLDTSPHIATYVHAFTYVVNKVDLADYNTLPIITRVISSLNRLREFNLIWDAHWRGSRPLLNWTHLPNYLNPACRPFCRTVETILDSEDLVCLNVHCISYFPFSIFARRSKVLDVEEDEGLRIKMTTLERTRNPPYATIRNYSVGMDFESSNQWDRLQVRKLKEVLISDQICLHSESPESGVPPFSFHVAESVSICLFGDIDLVAVEMILRLAHSIKLLSMTLRYEVEDLSLQRITQAILTGSVRTLQRLKLDMVNTEEPFDVLCEQLKLLSGHNVLRCLELIIYRDYYPNLYHLDLNPLDSTIRRNAFPHLHKFHLYFRLVDDSGWDCDVEHVPIMDDIKVHQLAQLGNLRLMDGLEFIYTLEWNDWSVT